MQNDETQTRNPIINSIDIVFPKSNKFLKQGTHNTTLPHRHS